MIHLALAIAAFLFLASLTMGAVALAIVEWETTLMVVAIVVLGLVIMVGSRSPERGRASTGIARSTSMDAPLWSPNPAEAATEALQRRFRQEYAAPRPIHGGEVLFVAMLRDDNYVRLLARFDGREGATLVSRPADVRRLLRDELCGGTGMFARYKIDVAHVVMAAYDHQRRLEVAFPRDYCLIERDDPLEKQLHWSTG